VGKRRPRSPRCSGVQLGPQRLLRRAQRVFNLVAGSDTFKVPLSVTVAGSLTRLQAYR
jgi:hypothetical protein